MAEYIPQSTARLVLFRAFLASDGKTPATGKTIPITVSKNGGAFGNPNAGALNATEISGGFYKFTLDTTDSGTPGPLAWRGVEGTINDAGDILYVGNVPADIRAELGNPVFPSDLGIASATVGTITLATPGTNGVIIPNNSQYQYTVFQVTAGTGEGQAVLTTTATGTALQYNVLAGTMPIPLDATSKLIFAGVWRANTTHVGGTLQTAGDVPAAVASIPTALQNADAYLDRVNGIETGITPRMVLRGQVAVLAGLNTGAGTGTEVFKAAGNPGVTRTTYVIDSNGNRTTVTLNW